MILYPVNMVIDDCLCLVIGGGSVATRKVESLLPCGANIRLISPVAEGRLEELAQSGLLEWQKRDYRHGDLHGAKLVFAATSNKEVQKQIVSEANDLAILVNAVDMPEACTFQVPASSRQGDLLLTVATSGGSPALAARIRKELEISYGPEYGLLVDFMAGLRREVIRETSSQAVHKQLFGEILESDILACIRERRWHELETLLHNILPPAIDISNLINGIQKISKNEKTL